MRTQSYDKLLEYEPLLELIIGKLHKLRAIPSRTH